MLLLSFVETEIKYSADQIFLKWVFMYFLEYFLYPSDQLIVFPLNYLLIFLINLTACYFLFLFIFTMEMFFLIFSFSATMTRSRLSATFSFKFLRCFLFRCYMTMTTTFMKCQIFSYNS